MAARANSAALNAALNAYVKEHEYRNLNHAVNNYAFGNYNWKANRNSRRLASGYYQLTENKQTRANINMMRNMKLNRMRAGVKTSKKTPKNKRLLTEARPRTPSPVRRQRNANAAARKANENRRMAAAAERARVAKAEKNAKKARIGTVDPAHIRPGVGFRVSAAGKAANGGGQVGNRTHVNRAQAPKVVLPPTRNLSENARLRLTTVIEREVAKPKSGGVQSRILKKFR
jgi:hypothetical protein